MSKTCDFIRDYNNYNKEYRCGEPDPERENDQVIYWKINGLPEFSVFSMLRTYAGLGNLFDRK